jgi:uncharacterized protein YjiS (DUF1127 family)
MHTITPTRIGSPLAAIADAWQALRAAAADLAARWHRQQERAATERALRQLSPHLLRDLGLDCSEIDSIAAAAAAGGDRTRLRMTQLARRQSPLL